MMKRLAIFVSLLTILPAAAQAGECWSEPYHEVSGNGLVKSGVFMRTGPCQENTTVLATAPGGTTVPLLAEDHGWYLIRLSNGATGWVWQSFLSIDSAQLTSSSREEVEAKFPTSGPTNAAPAPAPSPAPTPTTPATSASLVSRLKGRILLQVEDHGEAWYLNPTDSKRYYMKDGPTAYEMMRKFGLGISNADFAKLSDGNATLTANLKGKIVLEVERHGEATYIHPVDGSLHYLKDGAAAYTIMRELSLGITNADLAKVPSSEFVPIVPNPSPAPSAPVTVSGEIGASAFQRGVIPSNIDLVEANEYWLSRINNLRAERGLRQLVLDQRWVDTATEWAVYMGETGEMTHTRPDGTSMHQWIDAKDLDFTVRNSAGGWVTNYFTENISWNYTDNSQEGLEAAMEDTLDFMLAEAADNGPHYRTIYYPDWNSVGVGYHFEFGEHGYRVSTAYHYGSLVLR